MVAPWLLDKLYKFASPDDQEPPSFDEMGKRIMYPDGQGEFDLIRAVVLLALLTVFIFIVINWGAYLHLQKDKEEHLPKDSGF